MSVSSRSITIAVAAAAAVGVTSCAHTSAPPSEKVVLSVTGLDCAECGDAIIAELRKEAGVREAAFDRRKVEVTVSAAPGTAPARLTAAVARAGYAATVGPGRGAYLPSVEFPPGSDVVFLTKTGDDVGDLARQLVPGKFTVFDFYAEWCGPCREVDGHMKKLLAERPDVAYRKLNIVDWDTPLAQRHLGSAAELPFLVVHGPDGSRRGVVTGLHLDRLDALLGGGRP